MKEEQGGSEKESAKRKAAADERYTYTKEAGIEREGMARSKQSALPTEGMGEKPDAGHWDDMDPNDSTDMAQNKSRFGVFEKEGGSGPTVIKPGRDFGKGKDPRSLNQSGVYAEKDAQTWKEMAKSADGKDAEWCGTPSDESCEILGAPTGASKKTAEKTAAKGEETAPAGTQGQHWRGEPWAKNPKVGGKGDRDLGAALARGGQASREEGGQRARPEPGAAHRRREPEARQEHTAGRLQVTSTLFRRSPKKAHRDAREQI